MCAKRNTKEVWYEEMEQLKSSRDDSWFGRKVYHLEDEDITDMLTTLDQILNDKEEQIRDLQDQLSELQTRVEQKKLYATALKELGMETILLLSYLDEVDDKRRFSPYVSPRGYWNAAKGMLEIRMLRNEVSYIGKTHLENCISWTERILSENFTETQFDSETDKVFLGIVNEKVLPIIEMKLRELNGR